MQEIALTENSAKTTQAPIDRAATELSNCITDLVQNLDDLYTKLKPVLNPNGDPETSDSDPSRENPGMSAIQKYLTDETEHINNIAAMVRGITRRVEC